MLLITKNGNVLCTPGTVSGIPLFLVPLLYNVCGLL
jgi:hypothetical protein